VLAGGTAYPGVLGNARHSVHLLYHKWQHSTRQRALGGRVPALNEEVGIRVSPRLDHHPGGASEEIVALEQVRWRVRAARVPGPSQGRPEWAECTLEDRGTHEAAKSGAA
jgi:hypothetical protein